MGQRHRFSLSIGCARDARSSFRIWLCWLTPHFGRWGWTSGSWSASSSHRLFTKHGSVGPKCRNVFFFNVLQRPLILASRLFLIQEALKHFLVSDSVISALLLLRLFDDTEVSDSLDFGGGLLVSFLGYLAIDHLALGLCVFYSATLLYAPGVAHA